MIETLASLTLAHVGFLAALLAAPLLALAFRERHKRRVALVSSLMLLRTLKSQSRRGLRIKLPLRFYLQLLALCLLSFAASGPFVSRQTQHIAVILDNSMSMRALDSDGKSRFASGLEEIKKRIEEADSDALYSLFLSSPRFTEVNKDPIDRDTLIDVVQKLSPTSTSGSFEETLRQVASIPNLVRLIAVSDYSSDTTSPLEADWLDLISVGTPEPNCYFTSVRQIKHEDPLEAGDLEASVLCSGKEPRSVTVGFFEESLNPPSSNRTSAQSIKVGGLNESKVSFPLRSGGPGLYHLSLEFSGDGEDRMDSIEMDNQAWITVKGSSKPSLLVVSPQRSQSAFGLNSLDSFRTESVSAEQYTALTGDDIKRYSLVLFYSVAPKTLPELPSLLIIPPRDNSLFSISAEVDNPLVTSWDAEHPITSYLKVPLLAPNRATVFEQPLWASSIINEQRGPVLLAGELRGLRFAAVGFELLPFEGKKTPAASVLILNLFKWMIVSGNISESHLTGSSYRLDVSTPWIVITPQGDLETLKPDGSSILQLELKQPGFYQFARESTEKDAAASAFLLAANAFHPEESSTFVSPKLRTIEFKRPSMSSTISPQRSSDFGLWRFIVAGAIVFIILDLLLLIRSARSK